MRPKIRADKPDFDRLRTTFALREPDRVPAMEAVIDSKLKAAFLGRPVVNLEDEVTFWVEAGYDSITLNAWMFLPGEGPEYAMQADSRGKRQFSTTVKGLIQTWADYERYDWDKEKIEKDYWDNLEQAAKDDKDENWEDFYEGM